MSTETTLLTHKLTRNLKFSIHIKLYIYIKQKGRIYTKLVKQKKNILTLNH